MNNPVTPQMEEYLEAIGKLQERGEPVTPAALARACGVAAPSVTEMLRHLGTHNLVRYEPRGLVELTPEGAARASAVIRRHRLWERFLHDVLGLRWDQVHQQACELEHVTSPELESRLASAAGEHNTCPHGHVIPSDGALPGEPAALALCSLEPGQCARVLRMAEAPELLRRLQRAGIVPGAEVCLVESAPDGTLTLRVGANTLELPQADAALVAVAPLAGETAHAVSAALPLSDLAAGETGIVHGFDAGRGLVARCLALGFTPGAEVRVVQKLNGGPMIALVRDTRVALGQGEARRILVRRLEAADEASSAAREAAYG